MPESESKAVPAKAEPSQSKASADAADTQRARAKKLSAAFERHLKRGEGDKASKVLDKLAKVPGFAEAAKRKRAELKSWLKKRSTTKTK